MQSVTPSTWKRYQGHFGNWIHYHDTLAFEGELTYKALDICHDPPLFDHLHNRVRNFAAWERWRGNVGQTIGTTVSGFWRILQAFHACLLHIKALSDNELHLEREAADRSNTSQAKPVFPLHYAAMRRIHYVFTKVDVDGYPIYGVEDYVKKTAGFWGFLTEPLFPVL